MLGFADCFSLAKASEGFSPKIRCLPLKRWQCPLGTKETEKSTRFYQCSMKIQSRLKIRVVPIFRGTVVSPTVYSMGDHYQTATTPTPSQQPQSRPRLMPQIVPQKNGRNPAPADTPPKFNIQPQKKVVGRLLEFQHGLSFGDMLIFGVYSRQFIPILAWFSYIPGTGFPPPYPTDGRGKLLTKIS